MRHKINSMAYAKTQLFDNELNTLSKTFKALGHPARLAILQYLAETKICITGDICHELPLSRTTINQHLKELKEVGMIKGQIEGAKVNYCLCAENVELFEKTLSIFVSKLKNSDIQNC